MAHLHKVYDSDVHFKIDATTRTVINESDIKKVMLIQNDHNSERFTFELPRYIEEHDMTLCDVVEIHYINTDSKTKETSKDVYIVEDMQVYPDDENVAVMSWLLSRNATKYVGNLSFLLCFKCLDGTEIEYMWSTAIYSKITIGTSIYNSEQVVEEFSDVLEQWRDSLLNVAYDAAALVDQSVDKYMTENPVVVEMQATDETIQYSMDGEEWKDIIPISDLKGEKGDTGEQGIQGETGIDGISPTATIEQFEGGAKITITDANGTTEANIYDGGGENGIDGIGITNIEQTTKSEEDDGDNVISITLSDGSVHTFTVQNGSRGTDGIIGADGKSAYQYAQEGGYAGTEEEFITLLNKDFGTEYLTKENPSGTGSFSMNNCNATGNNSFATGYNSFATGYNSFATGYSTRASGENANAEGCDTHAYGYCAHAEGYKTVAWSKYQHVEGKYNILDQANKYAHIVGNGDYVSGVGEVCSNAHTLDWDGNAWFAGDVKATDSEGNEVSLVDLASNAGGSDEYLTKENPSGTGTFSMNRKADSTIGDYSFVTGMDNIASGYSSHATGANCEATTHYAHAEGAYCKAHGYASHAEGDNTQAHWTGDHAEGRGSVASGKGSHAEGYWTTASGDSSHSEGRESQASGAYAHAEGYQTYSKGYGTHTEGKNTEATGYYAHAEGDHTVAAGNYSHSEGYYTKATGNHQHTQGKYNIEDATQTYAHIVGNGESDTARSNAHTLDWDGNAWFAGDVKATDENGNEVSLLGLTRQTVIAINDAAMSKTSVGRAIAITDSANLPFVGMNIYGKSTQDGTPTVTAPIDIVSVADSGSIQVDVFGKNLVKNLTTEQTFNGITYSPNGDGGILTTGTATSSAALVLESKTAIPGKYRLSGSTTNTRVVAKVTYEDGTSTYHTSYGGSVVTFEITDDVTKYDVYVEVKTDITVSGEVVYPMLCLEAFSDNTFAAYTKQSISISTPNGLLGVTTPDGVNICDEIDLARGVYIQRVYKLTLDGSQTVSDDATYDAVADADTTGARVSLPYATSGYGLCTFAASAEAPTAANTFEVTGSTFRFRMSTSDINDAALAGAWFTSNPQTLIFTLETPIETALSADEIAAYKALVTYSPNTSVMVNDDTYASVDYITQSYEKAVKLMMAGDYLSSADVVNNLTSTATDLPLSANMGKTLNTSINNLYTKIYKTNYIWHYYDKFSKPSSSTAFKIEYPSRMPGYAVNYVYITLEIAYNHSTGTKVFVNEWEFDLSGMSSSDSYTNTWTFSVGSAKVKVEAVRTKYAMTINSLQFASSSTASFSNVAGTFRLYYREVPYGV